MFVAAAWIEAHCVIPDGDHRAEPFQLSDEQLAFLLNHYAVKDSAKIGERSAAFVFRRSQLVRAQKWGKSPLIAAFTCLEAVGPALFAGFATGGEVYDCRAYGCGCGFVYEYEPSEPMGRPWAMPLIQITATSEDQTDNTYDALRPMINDGPLSMLIPKTGEEFIRLPNNGRIEAVTSKANSRLGQRVTFAPQDETGLWVESNGGHKLARTQRRGLAGMGGRAIETTNAWNPAEDSVAQRTYESDAKDIQRDFRQPPLELRFDVKRDREKIFAFNYASAPWVDTAAIEAEAAEILEKNPTDAERFFGNRIVQGSGAWMPMPAWQRRKASIDIAEGARIVLGFDGSEVDDFTAIIAETLDGYQFVPTYHDGRRTIWDPRKWPDGRVPQSEVRAAFTELFARYDVVRAYCDPPFWATLIDELAGEHPKKVFRWETYRPVQMHAALERYRDDAVNPDSAFSHDGDSELEAHVRNAVELARRGQRYIISKASTPQKIDAAMAAVLAHEARADAVARGEQVAAAEYIYF